MYQYRTRGIAPAFVAPTAAAIAMVRVSSSVKSCGGDNSSSSSSLVDTQVTVEFQHFSRVL
jgi:hypothetical protein